MSKFTKKLKIPMPQKALRAVSRACPTVDLKPVLSAEFAVFVATIMCPIRLKNDSKFAYQNNNKAK